MKKFKSIQEWLATNPSNEEQAKVLNIIHRGETRQARKAIWEKERVLRKLEGISKSYDDIKMKPSKDILDNIKKIKEEIEDLKKDLPIVKPKIKKVIENMES